MLELLYDPNVWAAFLTLTAMEIVLGIDNIVFISVLVSRLPKEQADRARRTIVAHLMRLCQELGIAVIALGVEHADDLPLLSRLGFDGVTGPGVQ